MQLTQSTINSGPAIWREWLRSLPRQTGKSLSAIAKEIGKPASTLTRPLKPSDPGTSMPHQTTIDKIVARYNIAPPNLSLPGSQRAPLRGFSEDAVPYSHDNGSPLDAAVKALVAGKPNADPWLIRSRSLELAGYLPGDVVIIDLSARPVPGDAVCAQTEVDLVKGTATTVMRIYERPGSSTILVAASLDPNLRAPIAVDDRVSIMGVIVGMVRPLKNAA